MNRDMDQNERRNERNRRQENDQRQGREPLPTQRPGFEGQPMTPPPGFVPPGPGMEGQPRMAPPNFIPEPPGMERRPMKGPGGFEFNFVPEREIGRRDLRRCLNSFTFIWLVNGNSFWFYPTFIDRQFVQGFRWRRNHWEFDRININRIIFFRCF